MKRVFPVYAVILSALTIVLAGCASTSVDIVPIAIQEQTIDSLALEGLQLESIYSYTEDMNELQSLIISSAKKSGITIVPKEQASEKNHTVRFFFREKSYTKGFKKILSLAILAEIRKPDGEILYRITYLHDGEESFDSMGCVMNALDDVFRDLRKTMLTKPSQKKPETR